MAERMDEDIDLSLNIFVLGPSLENLHEIKISPEQTIKSLKKAICDCSPLMEQYEVAKSIMWKPKEPGPDISEDLSHRSRNILQWADSVDSGKILDLVLHQPL
ncbi:hypothetical protein CPB86DRAFT_237799 [Serendipita vermifera]|nr:hypothetical protein CPB86DRAFT_237799 [Serendipita vermifera]